ncbi:sigma E protease regulator RseP [Alginatibacterium sediminis]|uniref:Zinc metalloprotease n=1 Tax=Alginatibacterium sediminis TaxID=2164068 RepID=A0A420E7W5_9ALTE|nr:sigma E protease regulator RseP [Alginatibacterium sediminis]RKF15505.1 sigma E protease regulator RseP [Alginatibacterium sediminis]
MFEFLWNTAFFVITLGILVTVHEFGHFWVARRCGVKVIRFAVGFGKPLWRKTGQDGTEYVLAAIPLGGYVKMLDGRVDDLSEDEQELAFNNKPLLQRSAVVAAGPIANFLLAILAFYFMFLIGVPTVKPILGPIEPTSIAGQAGLQQGQQLVEIEGQTVLDWEMVNFNLVRHLGGQSIEVKTQDPSSSVLKTHRLSISQWALDSDQPNPIASIGLTAFQPDIYLEVANLSDDGAAKQAGLEPGDRLLSINGEALQHWQDFVEWIQASPETSLQLEVGRGLDTLSIELTPKTRMQNDVALGYVGLMPKIDDYPESYQFSMQYGVFGSVAKALERTWDLTKLTFSMIGKLITGVVSVDNLSGPISIAKGAGATADFGLVYFLGFISLVSINLGIINLLPLPVLDGGHLFFFALEAVRGKPVSEKIQEFGFKIGAALVFSLMALAIFNDFMRL